MTTELRQGAPYIFVSYASADRERAFRIADLVEARGVPVWIDRKSIAGGTSWSGEIVDGIKGCAVLVALISEAAAQSRNVQQEIQLAWENDRTILPLLLALARLPSSIEYALAGRQWVEILDHPDETWLAPTLRALEGLGMRIPDAAVVSSPPRSSPPEPTGSPEPAPRPSLPAPTTAFIGRERDRAALEDVLTTTDVRLVTLTGPGGVGKTRLALEVGARLAHRFPDGVIFVPLATLDDPALVAPTIAHCLGVRENGARPLVDSLRAFLREKACLLLLDNFEQVAPAVSVVGDLLASCPRIKVMVTSRSALRGYGEHEQVVAPLDVPDPRRLPPLEQLAHSPAVQLFVARARAVKADFALGADNAGAVAEICARLDGLPLAIELAAARVRVFSPAALLTRLDRRLKLLTGGAKDLPARQQTLRGAIAWSYELLDADERTLFRRLCVFVGSFDLASAEAVCLAGRELTLDVVDGVDSLVRKSLVRSRESSGEPSFALFETIREYGLERLEESGEAESLRAAHAAYFLNWIEEADRDPWMTDWSVWLGRLAPAVENARAALGYVLAAGDAERSLRLATGLSGYWSLSGSFREGRDRLTAALGLSTTTSNPALRAHGLAAAAGLAANQSDYTGVESPAMEALALYRALDDPPGVARMLLVLGFAHNQQGDYAGAIPFYDESLAIQRQLDAPAQLADTLRWVADGTIDRGDTETGQGLLAEALLLARRMELWFVVSHGLWVGGRLATLRGDTEEATVAYHESLAIARRMKIWPVVTLDDYDLAYLACQRDEFDRARGLIAEGLALARERDLPSLIDYGIDNAAVLAAAMGRPARAARLAGACTAIRRADRSVRHPIWQTLLRRARVPLERPADDPEAAAWDDGQAMTLEQAIAYALSEEQGNTER